MGQQVIDDGFVRGNAVVQGDLNLGKGSHVDSFLHWDRLGSTHFPVSSGGPEFAVSRQVEADQADQVVGGAEFNSRSIRGGCTPPTTMCSRVLRSAMCRPSWIVCRQGRPTFRLLAATRDFYANVHSQYNAFRCQDGSIWTALLPSAMRMERAQVRWPPSSPRTILCPDRLFSFQVIPR